MHLSLSIDEDRRVDRLASLVVKAYLLECHALAWVAMVFDRGAISYELGAGNSRYCEMLLLRIVIFIAHLSHEAKAPPQQVISASQSHINRIEL